MSKLEILKIEDIQRDENQPRKHFNEDALAELSESIKVNGVLQAITVRESSDIDGCMKKYTIVAGERRWRASQLAGLSTIPAVIRNINEVSSSKVWVEQLTENFFREDLNPVEKAEFLDVRIRELKESGCDAPAKQVATELGVSSSWISKSMAILKVNADIRRLVKCGLLRDYSTVKKLDGLSDARRDEAIKLIENGEFSAKVFFKRKRYEKIVSEDVTHQSGSATVISKPVTKTKNHTFTESETQALMRLVGFSEKDKQETESSENNMIALFKKWIRERAEKQA